MIIELFVEKIVNFFSLFKRYWIGVLLTALGFFIPSLLTNNMPLSILSGAFWLYLYAGYIVIDSEEEERMENFCLFSLRLSVVLFLVALLEIALKNAGVHQGPLANAFSWPMLSMGVILFILSLFGMLSLALVRYEKAMEGY